MSLFQLRTAGHTEVQLLAQAHRAASPGRLPPGALLGSLLFLGGSRRGRHVPHGPWAGRAGQGRAAMAGPTGTARFGPRAQAPPSQLQLHPAPPWLFPTAWRARVGLSMHGFFRLTLLRSLSSLGASFHCLQDLTALESPSWLSTHWNENTRMFPELVFAGVMNPDVGRPFRGFFLECRPGI